MRSLIHQAALGLVMSAGTALVCSVPSDSTSPKPTPERAGLAMCPVPDRSLPIDITQRLDTESGASGAGKDGGKDSPSLRRLRMAEDSTTPRRDYFDERWSDDAPRRPASRRSRLRARAAGAPDVARLTSGLESPEVNATSEARVRRHIRFLTESREGRDGFVAALERSGKYEEIITRAFDDRRLPRALIAAALVESGFSPTAVSPAGAAGLWQFMAGTAKAYGLRVENGYDERLSPWRSSQAAADHLADLYEHFRSWELALAAYNMGYNGLESRLNTHKAKTFWELADIEGGLPSETALYVPRVFAAATVMANLDAFGLDTVQRNAPLATAEVELPTGIPVYLAARAAGMPIRAFRELNNELVGTAAPRSGDTVLAHVPTSLVERTRATLARLDRGEIDPDDLERPREDRPRERSGWTGSRYGRERGPRDDVRPYELDADRGHDDLDDPRYLDDRGASDWRSARDSRGGRDDRDARSMRDSRPPLGSRATRDWDQRLGRYNPPPYARDPRDARDAAYDRDDDRDRDRTAPARPVTTTSTVFYRTVDGDSATSIGKTFGLPADEVWAQNGLKQNAALDKGTLLRLRVSAKALEKLAAL